MVCDYRATYLVGQALLKIGVEGKLDSPDKDGFSVTGWRIWHHANCSTRSYHP